MYVHVRVCVCLYKYTFAYIENAKNLHKYVCSMFIFGFASQFNNIVLEFQITPDNRWQYFAAS